MNPRSTLRLMRKRSIYLLSLPNNHLLPLLSNALYFSLYSPCRVPANNHLGHPEPSVLPPGPPLPYRPPATLVSGGEGKKFKQRSEGQERPHETRPNAVFSLPRRGCCMTHLTKLGRNEGERQWGEASPMLTAPVAFRTRHNIFIRTDIHLWTDTSIL